MSLEMKGLSFTFMALLATIILISSYGSRSVILNMALLPKEAFICVIAASSCCFSMCY